MTLGSTRPSQSRSQGEDSVERRRYFDSNINATVVQVYQGDFYATAAPDEALNTVLGSCISACVRDPVTKFGGMNHFLLPAGQDQPVSSGAALSLRYGSFAMEQLINAVLSAGGKRERLEIKVFGGSNVMRGLTSEIGHRNADFVEEYLKQEGFALTAKHLRGNWPRKVQFFPHSGQVRMRELKESAAAAIIERETRASPRIVTKPTSGTIELFD